jgi:phenylacetaldehyde dehydrogenase
MSDLPLYHMFVGGEHLPSASDKIFEVENPARGEAMALVSEGDKKDVDTAVGVAAEAFRSWGTTIGEERGNILSRAAQILRDRLDEFVRVEVDQTGRAYREMSAQLARLPEWY